MQHLRPRMHTNDERAPGGSCFFFQVTSQRKHPVRITTCSPALDGVYLLGWSEARRPIHLYLRLSIRC